MVAVANGKDAGVEYCGSNRMIYPVPERIVTKEIGAKLPSVRCGISKMQCNLCQPVNERRDIDPVTTPEMISKPETGK